MLDDGLLDDPALSEKARQPARPVRWRNWYRVKAGYTDRFGNYIPPGDCPGWFLWPSQDIAEDKARLCDRINSPNIRHFITLPE